MAERVEEMLTAEEARERMRAQGMPERVIARMLPEKYGKIQHLILENGEETFTKYMPSDEKEKQGNLKWAQDSIARIFAGPMLVSSPGCGEW